MATPHTCHVDCALTIEGTRKIHMMHAAEPSSAAGRYQWELNRAILDRGRRAWRESGQGQSRACRAWDAERRAWHDSGDTAPTFGIRAGYRASLYGVTA
jgi:hypothetical protein